MAIIGINRRVEPEDCKTIPAEDLKGGERIVESGHIVAQVVERIHEPFGGCRTNVHVRTHDNKHWCFSAGASVQIYI